MTQPLTDEEMKALRTARDATYAPGIVAAQIVFHGKENESGVEANYMLRGLAQRGYLRSLGRRGPYPTDVGYADGSVSIEYEITTTGREAVGPPEAASDD